MNKNMNIPLYYSYDDNTFQRMTMLPDIDESIDIIILEVPRQVKLINEEDKIVVARSMNISDFHNELQQNGCIKFEEQEDLYITSTIYKGMLNELKKAKLSIDDDFKCIVNRRWVITCKEWINAPQHMLKLDEKTEKLMLPKTYAIKLILNEEK